MARSDPTNLALKFLISLPVKRLNEKSTRCPVDPFVFPALGMSREQDGLTTNFNAFKIPESNFLVFEATVNTCRNGCQPANCDGPDSRSVDSFGRRRRRKRESNGGDGVRVRARLERQIASVTEQTVHRGRRPGKRDVDFNLKEIFRVYDSRDEISTVPQADPAMLREQPPLHLPPQQPVNAAPASASGSPLVRSAATVTSICVAKAEYFGLLAALFALLVVILVVTAFAGVCYRRATLGKLGSELGTPSGVVSVIASGVSFGPKRSDVLPAVDARRGSFHQSRYARETQQRFSYHQPDINAPSV